MSLFLPLKYSKHYYHDEILKEKDLPIYFTAKETIIPFLKLVQLVVILVVWFVLHHPQGEMVKFG